MNTKQHPVRQASSTGGVFLIHKSEGAKPLSRDDRARTRVSIPQPEVTYVDWSDWVEATTPMPLDPLVKAD